MLDMFTRGLLEKKYAQIDTENQIRQQQANTAGLVGAAQANSLNINAGLAPRLANAEIDGQDAQTQAVRLGLPFVARRAQSDIDVNNSIIPLRAAQTKSEIAGIGLTRANIGLTNANTATVRAQEKLLPITAGQYTRSLLSRIGGGMP